MSARPSFARSLAIAAAIMLGAVSTALAQGEPVTPPQRVPMTKEQPPDTTARPDTTTPAGTTAVPAQPAPPQQQAPPPAAPETTTTAPAETTTTAPAAPAAAAETTATVPTTGPSAGVWFIGIGGGVTFPISSTKDAYDRGWNAFIPIGWQQTEGPFGVRLAAAYNQLGGKTFGAGTALVTLPDAKIWSGSIDALLRMHISPRPDDVIYLLGGGGVFHLSDYATSTSAAATSHTKFGLEGGVGVEIGLGTQSSLFLEGRYTYVFTDVNHTQFIPITIGVKFF